MPLTEVASLRQKVEIMQKELSSNALKLNSAENAKNNLEQKLQKAEEQMTKQESSKVRIFVYAYKQKEEKSLNPSGY